MRRLKIFIFMAVMVMGATLFVQCGGQVSGDLTLTNLRTEYMSEPLGIDTPNPRFSWTMESEERGAVQDAYQVLVASSPEQLGRDQGDMWDSGRIDSNNSTQVVYDGEDLTADGTYHWKVRAWNQDGEMSPWSEPATFQFGLMNRNQWEGEWIGTDTTVSAPLLRKEFSMEKDVEKAFVYIAGIGYYELYVNGEKLGDHRMDPGTTNYFERVLYETYDVTEYLDDENALGIWLGNGWYRHRGVQEYGDRPKLLLQLNIEFEDGSTMSVSSDDSWMVSDSPIRENSIWDGEVYDARMEQPGWNIPGFDDAGWQSAMVVGEPGGVLDSQIMPPIKVMETRQPVSVTEPQDGVYVFDFGRNFTGWPKLYVDGEEGTEITLQTAEITNRDMAEMQEQPVEGNPGLVNTAPNRSAQARDIYILKGSSDTEVYEPRFTYHGFRYVQVTGFPGEMTAENIEAKVAFSSVEQVGEFSASNTLLDSIHQNIIWGQQSNLHSMPTDCPQRDERLGWMGDAHLTGEEAMYNFDMAAFYSKWIKDIQDIQADSGSVTDVVPNHWTGLGTPAWQIAYPLMVWYMYQYYGDTMIIEDHYENLKRWVDYMDGTTNEQHIVEWGRGDWVPPTKAYSPEDGSVPITSTGYLYRGAWIVSQFADVLGNESDRERYSRLANDLSNAINNEYLDRASNEYGSGSQTSNAFPLYLGIVPEENQDGVLQNLVDDIVEGRDNHLWTGILGTKALVEALPKLGHTELMYTIASQRSYPSWGYMITKGATTLWERWGGYLHFGADMNSLNHIMFGSVAEYFYGDLAGIRPASPGWETISVKPHVVGDLTHAEASTRSVRGMVACSWERDGSNLTMNVEIPANSTASVAVPTLGNSSVIISESGDPVWQDDAFVSGVSGLTGGSDNGDYIVFETGSGAYEFEMTAD